MNPYIKILRPQNLLIIILTQGLLRFCVIEPFFTLGDAQPAMSYVEFVLLVIATLLIAAGGYVINDYYDVRIDQVNKPDKVVAGKSISLRSVKSYYAVLTIAGNLIGFWLAWRVDYILIGFIFPVVSIMLWYYSSSYQKTILLGNFMIALMSGLVPLIVWLFELFALFSKPVHYVEVMSQLKTVGLVAFAYSIFAFLVTVIREILKDSEDKKGDEDFGFRTLPIVYGLKKARSIAFIIGVLLVLLLAGFQYYLFQQGFALVFWYLMIAVQTILLYLIFHISQAETKAEFHFLSNVTKIIMLAGILSMQLFYISV